MNIFARLLNRPNRTAHVAQDRLQHVLTLERTLDLPIPKPAAVSLKQAEDGLVIVFGDGAWPDLVDNLTMQLDSPAMREFFEGARVRIESGNRVLNAFELEDLSLVLAQRKMILNPRRAGADAGVHLRRNVPLIPPEALHSEIAYSSPPDTLPEPVQWLNMQSITRDPVLLIRHSIVAGQVIHYGGTIVIFGDVSPAAEVIAERDVLVFGRLRGVAHAGVSGNGQAVVGALVLAPTQVRIAGQIAHIPNDRRWGPGSPEIARVRDGRIVIEAWNNPEA